MKKAVLLGLFLALGVPYLLFIPLVSAGWPDSNYGHCRNITIDSSKVDNTLINKPVPVILINTSGEFNKTHADWHDIIFYDAACNDDGATLDFMNETKNSTVATFWVEVSSISNTSDTVFSMYYNYASGTDLTNSSAVFDGMNNFTGAWLMNGSGATNVPDASIWGSDGTKKGAGEPATAVGEIAGGQDYDGVDDYVSVGDASHLDGYTSMTLESNVYWGGLGSAGGVIASKYDGNGAWSTCSWYMDILADNTVFIATSDAGALCSATSTGTVSLNTWTHVAFRWNGANCYIYIDGAEDGSGAGSGTISDSGTDVLIGAFHYGDPTQSYRFNGTIDSVILSNNDRGASWIETSAYATNNTLLTIGTEELQAAGDTTSPTITLNDPVDGNITNGTDTITVNFNCSASDNINLNNVSLWVDNGTWHSYETNTSGYNATNYIFSVDFDTGDHNITWNCRGVDNSSNGAFATANRTVTVYENWWGGYTYRRAIYTQCQHCSGTEQRMLLINDTYFKLGAGVTEQWVHGLFNVSSTFGQDAWIYYNDETNYTVVDEYNRYEIAMHVEYGNETDNGDMPVNLVFWWDGNSTEDSSRYSHPITNNGATRTHGSLGWHHDFDGSANYFNITDDDMLDAFASGTLMARVNWHGAGEGVYRIVLMKGNYSSTNYADASYGIYFNKDGAAEFEYQFTDDDGGTCAPGLSTNTFSTYTEYNLAIKKGGATCKGIANGNEWMSCADSGNPISNSEFGLVIGAHEWFSAAGGGDGDGYKGFWNGTIDDVRIYNETLSLDAIALIYNNTNGTMNITSLGPEQTLGADPSDTTEPTVTLNDPADNNVSSVSSIIFNCSVTEENSGPANVTFYINSSGVTMTANETNSTNLINGTYIFTKTLINGDYAWTCFGCDDSDNCGWPAANRTVIVNYTDPSGDGDTGTGTYYNNELNTTNTEQNITFHSSEIVYITIPRRVNVTFAEWDITGYLTEDTPTLQENVSDYFTSGNWHATHGADYVYDSNYTTYGCVNQTENSTAQYYFNYTKTQSQAAALLYSSYHSSCPNFGSWCFNITISEHSDCIDSDPLELWINLTMPLGGAPVTQYLYYCRNSTDNWVLMRTENSGWALYEEAIWWITYPENITIDTGLDGENDYTNMTVFNTTDTVDLNITAINNYLHDTCTTNWATGYCDVPFNVSSVTPGILEISNINVTGEYLPTIGDCGETFYNDTLYFWFFDEVSVIGVNGSAEYTIEDTGGSSIYNTSISNLANFTICTLGDTTNTVNMTMIYWNATSDQRSYYFYHGDISSSDPENISLYQITSATSEKVEVEVRDANDNTVEDAYVNIQRYYVDENTYRTITIGKTDGTGKFITYIYADTVYYKFTISLAGVVSNTYSPMTITDTADDPETLTLYTTEGVTQFFDIRGSVGSSCYVNYTTNYTICTIVDASGLLASARLIVEHNELAGPESICDTSDTGSSITLSCFMGTDANGTYSYRLMLIPTPNPPFVFTTGYAYFPEMNIFGDYGLFPTFMLVLGTAAIALFSAPLAGIVAVIALGAGVALDIIEISGAALISLMAIAIMIFMKRGNT